MPRPSRLFRLRSFSNLHFHLRTSQLCFRAAVLVLYLRLVFRIFSNRLGKQLHDLLCFRDDALGFAILAHERTTPGSLMFLSHCSSVKLSCGNWWRRLQNQRLGIVSLCFSSLLLLQGISAFDNCSLGFTRSFCWRTCAWCAWARAWAQERGGASPWPFSPGALRRRCPGLPREKRRTCLDR